MTPNTAAAETNSEIQYTIAVFNTTPDTVWVTHVEGFLHNPVTGQGHGGANSDLSIAIPPFDLWTTKLGVWTMPDWPAGRWIATAKVITRTQYLQKTQDVTIQP